MSKLYRELGIVISDHAIVCIYCNNKEGQTTIMKLDRGGGRDVNTGVRVFYLRLKTDSNQVDWVFNNQDDGAGL